MSKGLIRGVIYLPSVGDGSYGSKAKFILVESVAATDKLALTRLREDLTQAMKDVDYLLSHCDPDGRCLDRDLQP